MDSESDFPVHQRMSYARQLLSEAKNRRAWHRGACGHPAGYGKDLSVGSNTAVGSTKKPSMAHCANALAESCCSRSNSKLLAR